MSIDTQLAAVLAKLTNVERMQQETIERLEVIQNLEDARELRMREQRDGTYSPRAGDGCCKTPKAPVSTALLGGRNGYAE